MSPNNGAVYGDAGYLAMAMETPLTEDGARSNTSVVGMDPTTSTDGLYDSPFSPLPNSLNAPRPALGLKRRAPVPEFEIYVDPDTAAPPPKKPTYAREDGRIPLGERKDFGNTAPRKEKLEDPITPSVEEWNRYAHQFRRPRPARPARTAAKRPRNTILYSFLELRDWKVAVEEIRAAYKKVAVKYHPDKVTEESKNDAHDMMTLINAAKDVLLNPRARAQYHKDGILPNVFNMFQNVC